MPPTDENGNWISDYDAKIKKEAEREAYRAQYEGGYSSADHAAANSGHYNSSDIETFRKYFNKKK